MRPALSSPTRPPCVSAPICPGSSVDFAGTIFVPSVKGKTNYRATRVFRQRRQRIAAFGYTGHRRHRHPSTRSGVSVPACTASPAWAWTTNTKSTFHEPLPSPPAPPARHFRPSTLTAGPEIGAEPRLADHAQFFDWRLVRGGLAEPRSGGRCCLGVHRGAAAGCPLPLGQVQLRLLRSPRRKKSTTRMSPNSGIRSTGPYQDLKLEAPWRIQGGISFEPNSQWLIRGLCPLSRLEQCGRLRGLRLGRPVGLRYRRPVETGRKVGPAPRVQLRQEPGQCSQRLESRPV